MKYWLKIVLFMVVLTASVVSVHAQCAMCAASVESNLKETQPGIGLSINSGILYLMLMPYLMFGLFGYLWYRNTHKKPKNAK